MKFELPNYKWGCYQKDKFNYFIIISKRDTILPLVIILENNFIYFVYLTVSWDNLSYNYYLGL